MTFLHAITYLYGATGVAILGSYVPQIRAAWRSVGGARDVSLLTWGFWVVTALISCLYAGLVVRDLGILLMGVGNLVGCLSVVATTVWPDFDSSEAHYGAETP